MSTTDQPRSIVIATNNSGKMDEFEAMRTLLITTHPVLRNIRFISQRPWAVNSPEETGDDFISNALIKARHTAKQTGHPAIGDDSGLVVDALGGAPGIYSARYAGADADDQANNQKLINALKQAGDQPRTARFVCALSFVRYADDPNPICVEGTWEGEVVDTPRGDQGFGYDPLFYSPEHGCTVGELKAETKHQCSHRAQALKRLLKALAQTA